MAGGRGAETPLAAAQVPKAELSALSWTSFGKGAFMTVTLRGGAALRFSGFGTQDKEPVSEYAGAAYGVPLEETELESSGQNWGDVAFTSATSLAVTKGDKMMFEVDLSDVSQCAKPSKDELELQFHEDEGADNRVRPRRVSPRVAARARVS